MLKRMQQCSHMPKFLHYIIAIQYGIPPHMKKTAKLEFVLDLPQVIKKQAHTHNLRHLRTPLVQKQEFCACGREEKNAKMIQSGQAANRVLSAFFRNWRMYECQQHAVHVNVATRWLQASICSDSCQTKKSMPSGIVFKVRSRSVWRKAAKQGYCFRFLVGLLSVLSSADRWRSSRTRPHCRQESRIRTPLVPALVTILCSHSPWLWSAAESLERCSVESEVESSESGSGGTSEPGSCETSEPGASGSGSVTFALRLRQLSAIKLKPRVTKTAFKIRRRQDFRGSIHRRAEFCMTTVSKVTVFKHHLVENLRDFVQPWNTPSKNVL